MKNKEYLIIIILLMAIIIGVFSNLYFVSKNKRETNIIKNKLYCYETLYNDNIIGNGCDEYFSNDSWYIEYKNR